jgi:hypothetical protein
LSVPGTVMPPRTAIEGDAGVTNGSGIVRGAQIQSDDEKLARDRVPLLFQQPE